MGRTAEPQSPRLRLPASVRSWLTTLRIRWSAAGSGNRRSRARWVDFEIWVGVYPVYNAFQTSFRSRALLDMAAKNRCRTLLVTTRKSNGFGGGMDGGYRKFSCTREAVGPRWP